MRKVGADRRGGWFGAGNWRGRYGSRHRALRFKRSARW